MEKGILYFISQISEMRDRLPRGLRRPGSVQLQETEEKVQEGTSRGMSYELLFNAICIIGNTLSLECGI